MNDKFDELTKRMAQAVTRRGALMKLSVGLAGIVLAALGLANKACANNVCQCNKPNYGCPPTMDCSGCGFYCGSKGHKHGGI